MYGARERKIAIVESSEFAATSSSTNTIAHTIERVIGPSKEAWETAKHEDEHRKAFRGLGRYAVFIVAKVGLNKITARWTASFTPDTKGIDTESPQFFQRMIDTAKIVGREQSGQDKNVEDHFTEKLNAWLKEDKLKKQCEKDEERMRRAEEAIARSDVLYPGQEKDGVAIKESADEVSEESGEKEVIGDSGNIYIAHRDYNSLPLVN